MQFAKLTVLATKYQLVNKGFNVTPENVAIYTAALEAMILNQTSFDDAMHLTVPTHIIRGSFDPFVVGSNIKLLQRQNPNVTVNTVSAGHEIRGLFVKAVAKALKKMLVDQSA